MFYFSLGLFNLLLLFSTKTSLDRNMQNVDDCLYALSILIVVSMLLRFVLNLLLCRSITERDPFNKIGDRKDNKVVVIMKKKPEN